MILGFAKAIAYSIIFYLQ